MLETFSVFVKTKTKAHVFVHQDLGVKDYITRRRILKNCRETDRIIEQ